MEFFEAQKSLGKGKDGVWLHSYLTATQLEQMDTSVTAPANIMI